MSPTSLSKNAQQFTIKDSYSTFPRIGPRCFRFAARQRKPLQPHHSNECSTFLGRRFLLPLQLRASGSRPPRRRKTQTCSSSHIGRKA